jgi:hypothetical protein
MFRLWEPTGVSRIRNCRPSLSWALAQPALADLAHVCGDDRAGLVWSDAPSCPRTFERMVDELRALTTYVAPGETMHVMSTMAISAALHASVLLVPAPAVGGHRS